MKIGKQLKLQRKFSGLTLSQLSRRMDTGRQYIYRLEDDKQLPSFEWMERFIAATGTSMRQFVGGKYGSDDPFLLEIARNVSKLSQTDRVTIMEVMKSL